MTIGSDNNFFDEFTAASSELWEKAAVDALKGAPFDKVMFTETYDGITLQPIYTQENFNELIDRISQYPGLDDYARSGSGSGFIKNNWLIAQETLYCIPQQYNAAIKKDIGSGQNVIILNLDHASQIHTVFTSEDLSYYDLIAPNITEFEKALNGIDILQYPIIINAGIAALPAAALLKAYCNKLNIDSKQLNVSFGFDPIGSLAIEGNLPKGLGSFEKDMVELARFAKENLGSFSVAKVNASICHNSGSNAIQELAYAVSCGVYYMRTLISGGFQPSEAAGMIKFDFSTGTDFFPEIAKLRAARIIWAKITDNFGVEMDKRAMFIHCYTSRRETTKYDPYVNILRFTTEAFASVLGGCNALSVGFFDEAYGMPGEFSRRVSRNIQNVIMHEAHVQDTIDPAGGSWYLESLTGELAEKAWAEFQHIESLGGIVESLKSEYLHTAIDAIYQQRNRNFAIRKNTLLGTNKYANLHEKGPESTYIFSFDEVESHVDKVMNTINVRHASAIYPLIDKVKEAYKAGKFMEYVVAALEAGATSGEIFSALINENEKMEWIKPILERRSSEPFDNLRDWAFECSVEKGNFPTIDFLTIGSLKEYKPRVDFSNDFFRTGGFEPIMCEGNSDLQKTLKSLENLQNRACVICSTDKIYEEAVGEIAQAFKQIFPDRKLILAGMPKDKVAEYKTAGIDEFIHVKADVYEILKSLQDFYGIRK